MKMDKEDESLRKYKEALLGKAASEVYAPKDDPRRVVLAEMRVICEGRKEDIVFKGESEQDMKKMKDTPFVLKEGCNYKITLTFRVQHEIVTGLKYVNTVYRKGIRVDKSELMIGSFPPQKDPHKMTFPKNGWDEAPKGVIQRGSYKAKSQLIDDDKQCHLEFEYAFDIKKDWTSDD
jgi:Rho GDP-dissociation inhibitor